MRFERSWSSNGGGSAGRGTYWDDATYSRLPRLPEHRLNGTFAWLTPPDPALGDVVMKANPVPVARLRMLARVLGRYGHTLPESFVTFMSDPELQRRMLSGTRCEWDMWDCLAPSPAEEFGFVLQFMVGQQGGSYCLYFARDGSCSVIAVEDWFDGDIDDYDCGGGIFPGPALSPESFLRCAVWVAPSFEHFLYRWWVEEVLWASRERPLPAAARDYRRLLADPGRPSLEGMPPPLRWAGVPKDQLRLF